MIWKLCNSADLLTQVPTPMLVLAVVQLSTIIGCVVPSSSKLPQVGEVSLVGPIGVFHCLCSLFFPQGRGRGRATKSSKWSVTLKYMEQRPPAAQIKSWCNRPRPCPSTTIIRGREISILSQVKVMPVLDRVLSHSTTDFLIQYA